MVSFFIIDSEDITFCLNFSFFSIVSLISHSKILISMAKHNKLGLTGEDIAANFLISNGYCVKERNWRSGHKELDIVAAKGELLVIVEVKTRRSSDYGNPEDAVDNRKIKRIVSATDAYLKYNQVDAMVRFDVITVLFGRGEQYEIKHIEDAFFAPIW